MKLPIRITVTGLFLMLSVCIIVITIYVQSVFGKDLAKMTMNDYFKIISFKIEQSIITVNKNSNTILKSHSTHLDDITYEKLNANKQKYLKIFTSQLEQSKELYAMYIGFKNNKFYEVLNLNVDQNLRTKYNATPQDRWLLVEVDTHSNQTLTLYDKNLIKTSVKKSTTKYSANTRPWYTAAIDSSHINKIGPYDFASIKARGITYSLHLKNDIVFAIDVLQNDFNKIIDNRDIKKSLKSFVVVKDKKREMQTEVEQLLYDDIQNTLAKNNSFKSIQNIKTINGTEYLYHISVLDTAYNLKEYIVSYVLLDEMVAPFMKKFTYINQVMIIIFLILIPLIWYFASVIVRPILSLVKDSKKVENREFDKIVPVSSFVYEIDILSKAIGSMSKSINIYQSNLEEIVEERTQELETKNKELELLSITDKLTNIYNRIMLDKRIDEEILKSLEGNHQFGMILIDIDYFKKVNDTHGHQTGDAVLVSFAKILKENLRKNDLVGRWGGEEFLIICSDSTLLEILTLAEKLRSKIEEYSFEVVDKKTASFGVATYTKNDTAKSIIERADEGLYKAKNEGRNRVVTLELDENKDLFARR